jgi:hypothetical protein
MLKSKEKSLSFLFQFVVTLLLALIVIKILELELPLNLKLNTVFIAGGILSAVLMYLNKSSKKILGIIYKITYPSFFIFGITLCLINLSVFPEISQQYLLLNSVNFSIIIGGLIIFKYKTDEIDISTYTEPGIEKKLSHRFVLAAIVFIGFILRIWDLTYIQWSDTYNLISAKALYENGTFIYLRNLDYTYFTAYLFQIFDASLVVARIFPIIASVVSIFLIYELGKSLVNRKVGLISAFLLAVSPVAIEMSSLAREYSLNSLILLLSLLVIFKSHDSEISFFKKIAIGVANVFFVLIYAAITNNTTLPIILLGVIISIFIFILFSKNYTIKNKIFLLICFLVTVLFISPISDNFSPKLLWQPAWFNIFFNPHVPYPMQWFSGLNTSTLLLFSIFLAPLLSYKKFSLKVHVLYIIFFSYIALFVLKYQDVSGLTYLPSRYLYHIHFIYVVIYAISIYLLWKLYDSKYYKVGLLIFIFCSFVSPQNIYRGAQHYVDLSNGYLAGNYPRVSSIGSRPDVKEFLVKLNDLNIIKSDTAVVLEGLDQAAFVYYFNYNIDHNRSYVVRNGEYRYSYDIAKKLYLQDEGLNIQGLDEATAANKEGVFITYQDRYPSSDFIINNTHFEYLTRIDSKKIYRWVN